MKIKRRGKCLVPRAEYQLFIEKTVILIHHIAVWLRKRCLESNSRNKVTDAQCTIYISLFFFWSWALRADIPKYLLLPLETRKVPCSFCILFTLLNWLDQQAIQIFYRKNLKKKTAIVISYLPPFSDDNCSEGQLLAKSI